MKRIYSLLVVLPIVLATFVLALIVARTETAINYTFVDRGGVSVITQGGTSPTSVGYARIQPNSSNTRPSGLAIFGLRQGGVLVSEAGVPASPLIQSGRIYAEVNGPVNTGIAIANPNAQPAVISFHFTNSNGIDFGSGSMPVAANSQVAAFLDEPPFNSGNSVTGTFTFSSSIPVSVIALRGLTNERLEFLITTLPVIPLPSTTSGSAIFPHFADGGGWTTQLVLVNPSDSTITGDIQFFSQGTVSVAGQPLSITLNGQTSTLFNYSVPRRSSILLKTSGLSSGTASGSIRVTPSGNQSTPSGLVIFSYKNGGFTVSEAGVPSVQPARAVRLYAEASTQVSSILTGVAIANPASTPIAVNLDLTSLAGGTTIFSGFATIPGNGQIAKFLNEIQGLESLPRPFKGVLRVSTSSPTGVAVMGLRSRVNERGDFLITTTPPADENLPPATAEAVFPHFADNGGYTTQFILFSGSTDQQSSGLIRIIGQNGQPLDLRLASFTDLAVTQTAPASGPIGSTVTYAISVTNNGPVGATSVQLTDVLPSGAAFQSVTPTQGSCVLANGLVNCSLGSLAVGANIIVNVVVRADSQATLVNTVSVSATEDDSISANNQNVATTLVALTTDLEITQPSFPPTCSIGSGSSVPTGGSCDDAIYVINVQNRGPSTAPNVVVTNILPTDPAAGAVVATRKSVTTSQGTCFGVSNGQFTCNLGTLLSGSAATIHLVLSIDATVIGRVVTNRATVSSNSIVDNFAGNNTRDALTTVTPTHPETNLEVVQFTSSASVVTRPTPITFNATIVNNGRSTATGVTVTTTLSGLSGTVLLQSATSTQGTCSIAGSGIVCNIGTLVKSAPKNISIVIVPSNPGVLNAEIVIAGNPLEEDPNEGNNTRLVIVTVN